MLTSMACGRYGECVYYRGSVTYTTGLKGVGIEDGAPDVDADEGDEEIAGKLSSHGLDRTSFERGQFLFITMTPKKQRLIWSRTRSAHLLSLFSISIFS